MKNIVKNIIPGTPASRTKIMPGDTLRKINGSIVGDVLDYRYLSYDRDLLLELSGEDGRMKLVRLKKQEGGETGIVFDTFLMDRQRACANKCIFCFIDQLPDGMRETLYYKDDDVRLSFLQGNYVTLTNLSKRDVERIAKLRISPINVSVHTLDPELRSFMLGSKKGEAGLSALKTLAQAGITLNCQIVCCPGINDGEALQNTIEGLCALGNSVNSVSVVPVGLTKHRGGLVPLRPFDRELAISTVLQVEAYAEKCYKKTGRRIFFCADELYIKAGRSLPSHQAYEGYPQLENGVGMMRLFAREFINGLKEEKEPDHGPGEQFSVATGTASGKYLTNLLKIAAGKYGKMKVNVHAIRNDFFGQSVTVSGLVTGGDIIKQLGGRDLGSGLLIPRNMLRNGEDIFLDDVTVEKLSSALGVPVKIVEQNGADLLRAVLGVRS